MHRLSHDVRSHAQRLLAYSVEDGKIHEIIELHVTVSACFGNLISEAVLDVLMVRQFLECSGHGGAGCVCPGKDEDIHLSNKLILGQLLCGIGLVIGSHYKFCLALELNNSQDWHLLRRLIKSLP